MKRSTPRQSEKLAFPLEGPWVVSRMSLGGPQVVPRRSLEGLEKASRKLPHAGQPNQVTRSNSIQYFCFDFQALMNSLHLAS